MTIRGLAINARAMAIRWRWPPDRDTPRSSTQVSYPRGISPMNSWAPAMRAAAMTRSMSASGMAMAMFSRTVPLKRKASWGTMPMRVRRNSGSMCRRSMPSTAMTPSCGW